jgi:hypothetical protein
MNLGIGDGRISIMPDPAGPGGQQMAWELRSTARLN